jgi:hypothetical protein
MESGTRPPNLALIATAMPTAWLGGKLRVMELHTNRP